MTHDDYRALAARAKEIALDNAAFIAAARTLVKKLTCDKKPRTGAMPESDWYLSQRGVKAAEKAFGPVEIKKKAPPRSLPTLDPSPPL